MNVNKFTISDPSPHELIISTAMATGARWCPAVPRRGSSDRLVSSPLSPPMDSPSSASPEPGVAVGWQRRQDGDVRGRL